MKKITIIHNGEETTITAPEGKEMVFDGALLQHGVLSLGEYGPSGTKICAFNNWDHALFFENGDESGYTITKPRF